MPFNPNMHLRAFFISILIVSLNNQYKSVLKYIIQLRNILFKLNICGHPSVFVLSAEKRSADKRLF